MAIRIKWDEHETALLIDTFWKIEKNPSAKKQLISKLSSDLRRKAINSGVVIDETFRNENGISMQLAPIAHSFFPDRPTLTTSSVFEKMVHMYNEDKPQFNHILFEARQLVEGGSQMETNMKQSFLDWLTSNSIKKYSENNIVNAMEEAAEYCIEHGICKKNIWNITDSKEMKRISAKLLGMRFYRLFHKNEAMLLDAAFPYYIKFLKDQEHSAKQEVESVSTNDNVVATERQAKNESVPQYEPFDNETGVSTQEKAEKQEVDSCLKGKEIVAESIVVNLPKATREGFFSWMLHNQKLAQPTCASYASGISVAEQYAQNNISSSCHLYGGTTEEILFTIRSLNQDRSFISLNAQQHNRYLSAIRKYLAYLNMNVDDIYDENKILPLDEQSDTVCQQNEQIVQTLIAHYPYGFKVSSPIELLRFRNGYNADHGTECPFADSDLIKEINNAGFEFCGKVYVVTNETHSKLKDVINDLVSAGISIIYYNEFYAENESWLYSERIVSVDMMREVIRKDCYRYQFKPNYFITSAKKCSELEALKNELIRVWGEVVTRNFTELKELLPFVPLEKIKYALSYGEKFTWNSAETYARNDFFHITEGQLDLIRDTALDLCADNGAASFDDLPLEDIMAENFEYSESAIQEIVAMHLANNFTKNNKVLVRKGEGIDATTAIVNYCKTRESCSMGELEQLMKDTVGDVRYPVVIEAGNSAMVRVSEDNFVADDHLQFDSDTIDALLDEIVEGNGIGMKEVSTFNAFPFCGYAWNLFVLESYCRRFSHKYRYDCITPNSRNAGAIIKKNCSLDFHSIMIESVARSSTKLNEKDVYDYLIEAGFFLRRQYNNMADLLEKAAVLREGSE